METTERWLSKECERGVVSVIVPTYNRAHLLGETLDSVVAQTYRPIELIIVDDGSEDDTEKFVNVWRKGHGEMDGCNVHFHARPHRGTSATWNWGVQESRGEFIQLLDSDDLLGPDKIARQVAAGSAEMSEVVCGAWKWLKRKSSGWETETHNCEMDVKGDLVAQWLEGRGFPLHSLLWPRAAFERFKRWEETLATYHDADLFIRAVFLGCKFRYVPDSCVYYRVGYSPTSASNQRSLASLRSHVKVLDFIRAELHNRGQLEKYRAGLAQNYYSLARVYSCFLPQEAEQCYEQFLSLSPDGRVPGTLANHMATRSLGVVRKELLARRMHIILDRILGTKLCR